MNEVNQLSKTFDLVLIALMVALLIIGAKLSLAVGPVPLLANPDYRFSRNLTWV